ncbi:UDP-N-acetylglucosamine 2-epimerase (non-hydrolyzing), partial [Candidatus Pelagibacter ubique]|nr:UDP-N-acetylglucosamine 2-epimerase (non-hydrolyzing) [Candidatus Pelagibacter ubique]
MKSLRKKILTIIGTRPEIIRLSKIIPKLDKQFNNILVHTGQNYDYELDELFFKQLKVRKPNYYLNARGSFAKQISTIIYKLEKIIEKEKPSKFLVLGDTNSSVGSIVAKRMGIKVYHMEAGNRCYSDKSPEEVNRKIIDHSSDTLLPYTSGSHQNLILEGIKKKNIVKTGNPITEVMHANRKNISKSNILKKLNLKKNNFFVLTIHRQENVDNYDIFKKFVSTFNKAVSKFDKKIVWPIHPRSKKMLKKFNINLDDRVLLIKPLGFFDFVRLEKDCLLTLTDSGTVQEESAILKKPCLIIREYTERPETIKAGGATLVGSNTK